MRNALDILHAQDVDRVQELVPLRYQRMSAGPFAFLRGSAAVMASDLSLVSTSGLYVQACGDAHISNFGLFASAERTLVFDVNDFDETLPAPFDYDVRRLAASVAVAALAVPQSGARARSAQRRAEGNGGRRLHHAGGKDEGAGGTDRRLGARDGKLYLGSPATVAPSAVTGRITDAREFFLTEMRQ